MLLGGAALLVDRFMPTRGGAPADALAVDVLPPAHAAPPPASANGALSIPELRFPQNLPRLSAGGSVRDLFSRTARHDAKLAAEDGAGRARPSDSATFMARHKLEGVMTNRGIEIAVVDGEWLHIGQSIDGCRLVKIEGTRAHFVCQNEQAVLDLRPPSRGFLETPKVPRRGTR